MWDFPFLQVCMRIISSLTCKDAILTCKESQVVAMESFSIELKETIELKCSKKRRFQNTGRTYALFDIY